MSNRMLLLQKVLLHESTDMVAFGMEGGQVLSELAELSIKSLDFGGQRLLSWR